MQRQASRRYPKVGHIIFLFEGYSSRYYWYELADTLRRLSLTAGLSAISHMESVLSPTVGLLLSLVSVHVAEWRPFKRQGDNFVGITNEYVTTLLFLAAVLIKTNASSQIHEDDVNGWILVGIFSVAPIVAFCKVAIEYWSHSRGAETTDDWMYYMLMTVARQLLGIETLRRKIIYLKWLQAVDEAQRAIFRN